MTCVEPAEEVLAGIEQRYLACCNCPPEPNLDKTLSLESLPEKIERCQVMRQSNAGCGNARCLESSSRSIGLRDNLDTLRSVGSPLIEVGYPLAYSPRLGLRSLIIFGERLYE